jgi:RND family efflux transporter MFP subunit
MKLKLGFILKASVSLIFVAVVAVIIWQMLVSLKSHRLLTSADHARKAGLPIPVSTVTAVEGRLNSVVAAECVAKESMRVDLSFGENGKILKVNTRVGEAVSKGRVLVKMDDSTQEKYLENIREAELTLETLREEIEPFVATMRDMKDSSFVPVTEVLDAIERQRRVDLDLIRVRREKITAITWIENSEIVSPISGVVTQLNVEVGSVWSAFSDVISVSRLDPIRLECEFAADTITAINNFDMARVRFMAYPGKEYVSQLEKILPESDTDTHALTVQFKLPNKQQAFLPGMQAIINLDKQIEGINIPATSLINPDAESAHVFVVDETQVVNLIKIGIGRYGAGFVEVTNGISSGQRIVIAGQSSLQNGDKVIEGKHEIEFGGVAKTLFHSIKRQIFE